MIRRNILISIILAFKFLLQNSQQVQAQPSTAESNLWDIQSAMAAVVDKVHNEDCVVALIYDDLIPSTTVLSSLIGGLQRGGRMFLILDLSISSSLNETEAGLVMAKHLHALYRMNRCYTFLIWLNNPRVLYPETFKLHPGWRREDVVIFTAHHVSAVSYRRLIELRLWKEIPNIVGLKRKGSRVNKGVNVFTVLPYFKSGVRKSHEIDVWLLTQRVFQKNATLVWDKFTSFNGALLQHVALWKPPYLIFGDAENPYLDGLDWRLMCLVRRRLKFNMSHSLKPTSGRFRNGSWSGVLGDIESGLADIGIGGLSVNPARLEVFDFCRTYYSDSYSFISPIRRSPGNIWDVFLKPLGPEVWAALGVAAVLVSVSMRILAQLDQYMETKLNRSEAFRDHWFTSITHNLMHLLNIFCQKSFRHLPKSSVLKLAYIGTSFSLTILGIVYAGCLFTQLLLGKPDTSINRLRDIRPSKLKVGIRDYDGHLNDYFNNSGRVGLSRLWKASTLVNYTNSFTTIDNVVMGTQIYVDAKSTLSFTGRYNYMGKSGFKFHIGSEDIIKFVNVAWPTRKNWPFKPKVDRIIIGAVESGLVQHWMGSFKRGKFGWSDEAFKLDFKLPAREKRSENVDPTAARHLTTGFKPIGWSQVMGMIVLWAFGISLSILAFIGEIIMGRGREFSCCKKMDENELLKQQAKFDEIPNAKLFQRQENLKKRHGSPKLQSESQPIVWTDFDYMEKWKGSQAPGLVSRKKPGNRKTET